MAHTHDVRHPLLRSSPTMPWSLFVLTRQVVAIELS